jgi:hypothetical protein
VKVWEKSGEEAPSAYLVLIASFRMSNVGQQLVSGHYSATYVPVRKLIRRCAGALSGFLSSITLQPLDLLKTRLQQADEHRTLG